MTSIRGRVTLWTIVGTVAVLGVAVVVWHRTTVAALSAQFDRALLARATALASLVEPSDDHPGRVELEAIPDVAHSYRPGPGAAYYVLWQGGGDAIARSPSLVNATLPRLHGPTGEPTFRDTVLPDGRSGRLCGLRWQVRLRRDDEDDERAERAEGSEAIEGSQGSARTRGDATAWTELVVADDRTDLDAALASLRTSAITVCLALALGAATLVSWLVARGLRPLRALGRAVEELDPHALPERLRVREVPDELRPVVDRLDDMLGRVRGALERERRTTAALAHELRTPIAELRSLTDVALKWPEDDDYRRRALTEANGIAIQMEGLADTVLGLTRAEAGELEPRIETFDLAGDVRALSSSLRTRAAARYLDLDIDSRGPALVRSDRGMTRIVCANLLANAIEHSPDRSRVGCSVTADSGPVVVRIDNVARGLTAGDLPRLTERFWRRDLARTQREHSGLGLALTRELCERLGADLTFALEADHLVATVTLPAARSASGRAS